MAKTPTEEFTLYDGALRMKFQPGQHIYKAAVAPIWKFIWVPGATSISGFMDNGKCEALKRWALRMGLEHLAGQLEAGRIYDEIELAAMFEQARKEPFAYTKKAATIGDVAHDYVEAWIKFKLGEGKEPKKPVNKMAGAAAQNFHDWDEANHVEYVFSERRVMSIEHWFAGTLDILAQVNGDLTVVDLKTSNYLSAEHPLQVTGYQIALEEEFEEDFKNRIILHLDKAGGDITVYDLNEVAGTTKKLTPWSKINFHTFEEDKVTFLGLRAAFRGVRNG